MAAAIDDKHKFLLACMEATDMPKPGFDRVATMLGLGNSKPLYMRLWQMRKKFKDEIGLTDSPNKKGGVENRTPKEKGGRPRKKAVVDGEDRGENEGKGRKRKRAKTSPEETKAKEEETGGTGTEAKEGEESVKEEDEK